MRIITISILFLVSIFSSLAHSYTGKILELRSNPSSTLWLEVKLDQANGDYTGSTCSLNFGTVTVPMQWIGVWPYKVMPGALEYSDVLDIRLDGVTDNQDYTLEDYERSAKRTMTLAQQAFALNQTVNVHCLNGHQIHTLTVK